MRQRNNTIDKLLTFNLRREFKEQSVNWSRNLSLPNAQKLTRHLAELEPLKHVFRLGIIHTYTSDLLDPWFDFHSAVLGLELHTYHAPYGMNLMESQAGSGLAVHEPDMTIFLLSREDLHPELTKPISEFDHEQQNRLREDSVTRLRDILAKFRTNVPGLMIVTILPRIFPAELGLYDAQADRSEGVWWASLKEVLATSLGSTLESVMFLDLDQMLTELGREQFFDPRFWYTSRFPFTPQAANELARRIINWAAVSKYPKAKVLVLDADNTLWGGIIGEDGISGIALGPDYPGNTYVDFQRRILDYQSRGFILAICSKNNPEDVLDVLENHPHQVLRDHHFAAKRINWLPKNENLVSLADELNLGLDSFIFVDDSDHECASIRRLLPEVHVVQTPTKAIDIPACLEQVSQLEILSLTQEDAKKTALYAQEFERRKLKTNIGERGGDISEYLASLNMKMTISLNAAKHVQRLTQLTQKTNQFNLTTHRYNEQQMLEFIESEQWTVGSFSLADIFGDSGIVGLAIFKHLNSSETEIDSFLMSCRVIGRQAETAFLEAMLNCISSNSINQVTADFLPTLKNKLVENFYQDHNFSLGENGRYSRNMREYPFDESRLPPIAIEMVS